MAKRSFFDDLDTLLGGRNRSSQTTKKVTWQQFLQKTSDDLDRMLIAHAKKEGLVYIGGKCRFTVTAAENNAEKFILNVDAELYYKDQFKAEKTSRSTLYIRKNRLKCLIWRIRKLPGSWKS